MKKHFVFFTCILILGLLAPATSHAQTSPKQEFALKAHEVDSLATLLLPAVQKVREAAARNLATILTDARSLAQRVEKAGTRMSESQYQGFQRDLTNLETRLNTLANSTNSSSGKPASGTAGACHKSCHDAFGNGFGGGKGWNRFWCKVNCFTSSLPGL